MAITTANQVADYILWSVCDKGDLITNLKLQKLLYYAQAWYLALYDEPLFDGEFQAWIHGPVHPETYQRFRDARWQPINCEPYFVYDVDTKSELPENVTAHIDEVLDVFSDFSARTLEQMTHNEAPWANARRGLPPDMPSNYPISQEDMKQFYRNIADAEGSE